MNPVSRIAGALGLLCGLMLGAPQAALACVPALGPPPTPEEAAAQQLAAERDYQHDLWLKADHVFVARAFDAYALESEAWERELAAAEARLKRSPRDAHPAPPVPRPLKVYMLGEGKTVVTLEPLSALKGALPARRLEVVDQAGWTSCGPLRQFDAFYSVSDDDRFVVFTSGAYPTRDAVLEAIAVDKVIDPDLRAALSRSAADR